MDVENCRNRIENIRETGSDSVEQCRICLKSSTSHYDLFQDGKNIARKLMTFANVQVSCCAFYINQLPHLQVFKIFIHIINILFSWIIYIFEDIIK